MVYAVDDVAVARLVAVAVETPETVALGRDACIGGGGGDDVAITLDVVCMVTTCGAVVTVSDSVLAVAVADRVEL